MLYYFHKHLLVIPFLWITGYGEAFSVTDTIWVNANVITISKMGDRAQAIGVRNKKIISVGSNDLVRKSVNKNAVVIDLKGKTVVPGFNDAHLHPSPKYPFESVHGTIDLGPGAVKNTKELVDLLKRKAAITPERYSHTRLWLSGHQIRWSSNT